MSINSDHPKPIKIRFFARIRERLNTSEIAWPTGNKGHVTVAMIRNELCSRGPEWLECFSGTHQHCIAVNQSVAREHTLVKPGDEVAFFPPVTGG